MKTAGFIKQNYWLIAILFLASFLRFFHLDFQSVWMDEIYTLNISDPSFTLKQLHDEVIAREGFPYLYFLILRGFYTLFGYSELVARIVSAIGGVAGVAVIYIFAKNIFNRQVGYIAAFLLAINEFHIALSQEARPYSLFILFALIAFYRLSVFIKTQTLKNALWFGLAAGLMLNINFFAIILLFSQGLLLLLAMTMASKTERIRIFKYSCLAGILALLLFAPNYEMLIKLVELQSFWVPEPKPDSFTIMFKELLGNSEITLFIFISMITYYAIILFKKRTADFSFITIKQQPLYFSFIILFVWFVSYFEILYIKSYLGTSLVLSRYFISFIPVFVIVIAIGIYYIKNSLIKAGVIFSILVMSLTNLFVVKGYYNKVSKSQFREVSTFIKENNKNDDQVYTSLTYWYNYFLGNGKINKPLIESTLEDYVKSMMADSTKIKSFWYADAHNRPFNLDSESQRFLDKYFYLEDNFEGFDAWTRHYKLKTEDAAEGIAKFNKLESTNGDTVRYSVENFENTGEKIKAVGWAYFPDQEAVGSKINLILIKEDTVYRLPTLQVIRNDVAGFFGLNYNIDNCGFIGEYFIDDLEPGEYKIGIYLINETTKKEGFVITDKIVAKQ